MIFSFGKPAKIPNNKDLLYKKGIIKRGTNLFKFEECNGNFDGGSGLFFLKKQNLAADGCGQTPINHNNQTSYA